MSLKLHLILCCLETSIDGVWDFVIVKRSVGYLWEAHSDQTVDIVFHTSNKKASIKKYIKSLWGLRINKSQNIWAHQADI